MDSGRGPQFSSFRIFGIKYVRRKTFRNKPLVRSLASLNANLKSAMPLVYAYSTQLRQVPPVPYDVNNGGSVFEQ
jgi:hypothetical protein